MGICLLLTGLSESFGFAFAMRLITGMGNEGSYIPVIALPASWQEHHYKAIESVPHMTQPCDGTLMTIKNVLFDKGGHIVSPAASCAFVPQRRPTANPWGP